jgi:membrane protease YdiL (CAAX protease family)
VLFGAISTFIPEPESANYWETDIIVVDLVIAVIAAPLIETLLFQPLIIEVICKIIKRPRRNIYIAVFASALAFALNHTYSVSYVIYTFTGGIIYSLAYYLGRYRKESAIILVFLLHSLDNLLASLYNMFVYVPC